MFFAALLLLICLCETISKPTIGVIRWDAYNQVNGSYTTISNWSYIELLPKQFHYRLPFYTIFTNDNNNISFNEQQQSIIDKEILYANLSGIDYWSFVTYPVADQMDYGINLYLSSTYKNLIKFNMIWDTNTFCSQETMNNYAFNLFKESTYFNVLNNRPLLYLFSISASSCSNNASNIINYIRNYLVHNMGLNNPYIVILDGSVTTAINTMNELNLDGISLYAFGGSQAAAPFTVLHQQMNWWWNQCLISDNNCSIITPIPLGWDPRPRNLNPPPWTPNGEGNNWYYYPNKTELINYITDAINWTCNNLNTVAQSQSLLMYAWDEFSENGASVCPTAGENGTFIVDTLSTVLPAKCS